jgi:hypothetical protein
MQEGWNTNVLGIWQPLTFKREPLGQRKMQPSAVGQIAEVAHLAVWAKCGAHSIRALLVYLFQR